ncbi:hypothetical protein NEOKW01_0014 [Nematocida sp. AWRm80]|nr:hypothetical protein NEOKW01_0014 [Nematocida sp. AWRm80]
MDTNATEKLANSEFMADKIIHSIDLFKNTLNPFNKILLEFKKGLSLFLIDYFNVKNVIIKDEEFRENIMVYKHGIVSAIEISKDSEEKFTSLLNDFTKNPEKDISSDEKKELADILENEVSMQLNDIILGLWNIRKEIKDKEGAITQFNDLAKACSALNSLVKDCIIDKIERSLEYIHNNKIDIINYNSIEEIGELPLEEVLEEWDIMMPSSETIIRSLNDIIDGLLSIQKPDTKSAQQKELEHALSFFKTVANNLLELVGKKYSFPNLSAIHSDKDSFFKKFTNSALKGKTADELVVKINDLYKTASETPENMILLNSPENRNEIHIRDEENMHTYNSKLSLLNRFKSLSRTTRVVIVLYITVMIIIIISLLVYVLSSKETVHLVPM